jgi:hypothetical protein
MTKAPIKIENGHVYEHVSPFDLLFDPKNPRLVEYGLGNKPSQIDLIRVLWQRMAVDELVLSIASRGYFEHEPMFVASEGGKPYVIEGNRRLAAVRILLDPDLQAKLRITALPKITAQVRKNIERIPIIRTTREEIWQYIGFKHVNGPAKWGSYAKAEYIAEVREKYDVSLEKIAEQIGDKNKTVQRLYRAMMVIRQAESTGVFHRDNRYKDSFSFSHLYTGLNYDGFKRFLQLTDESAESPAPVPRKRIKNLGEVCRWLYGDKRDNIRPIIESQNPDLSTLDEVLQNDVAVDALRSGLPLGVAKDVSLGDERIFRESLQQAKLALQRASGTFVTGYKKEDADLMRTCQAIADMAEELLTQMLRKPRSPRNRRTEDEVDV